MRSRDVLAGLGIAVGLLGLGFAVAPGLAGSVDLSVIPLQFVGFAAVGLAILGYLARRRTEQDRADPPVVESVPDLGRPGSDADEALTAAGGFGLLGHTSREELRDRLFSVAVDVIVTREGCTPEEAATMLRAGTWTDDPRAVAMFSADPPSTPLGDVFAGIVTGRSQFVVQATHAIDAIRGRLGGAVGESNTEGRTESGKDRTESES